MNSFLSAMTAVLAIATSAVTVPPRGPMRSAPSAEPAMKAALRDLVARQEEYFSTHGTYTTDLSALGTYGPGKSRPDSALVQVIFAGGRGWTGLATHPGAKGRSCVIFIGVRDELPKVPATMGQKLVAQQEAVPLCDAM